MIMKAGSTRGEALPKASVRDSLALATGVFIPTIAKGPIIRRPRMVARAERKDSDAKAVRRLQMMREKYGEGPLMIRMPGRHQAVILSPEHVRRILNETPDPFSPASSEKRAALAHFEPRVSLISEGAERHVRRKLNEQTLEHEDPIHALAESFLLVIDEEAPLLLERAREGGELRFEDFYEVWFTIIRRVVFGDAAREDHRITDLMETLRGHGNWAFLHPRRTDLRRELHERIGNYLSNAAPNSLAAIIAQKAKSAVQAPENQVPQWLFASDPAAMATFRALGLLATHPDMLHRARAETRGGLAATQPHRPFLRAAVLESLRLWPTTPMVLRETTRETKWENGVMPARTGILIFAPYFHRDDTRLPYAHRFSPDLWLEDDPQVRGNPPKVLPFIPFSGGSGICPGRNLVLLLTSGMLAAIIGDRQVKMINGERLNPLRPLPGTLDHFTMRFALS